ncbi:MAG: GNAT family N-acetyltransferase [Planctomycetota bacterium]
MQETEPTSERASRVELLAVDPKNLGKVLRLRVAPGQEKFVADNARSLAEAYVYPDRAWPRAICVDGEPVGFAMLDVVGPDHPEAEEGRASYFLWRLMIDADHQRRGYGRAAIAALVAHVKTLPDGRELKTSYVPGEGTPGPFYEGLGFVPTGEMDDDEVVLSLSW